MVAGTGEAPSGLLAYEHTGLPQDLRGALLVTSWGDHRIESHQLEERGATYRSTMRPVVVGGERFRPVGIGTAPDGSVYFSDWVDREYKVHGKGRVWKLSRKPGTPKESAPSLADVSEAQTAADFDRLFSGPIRQV